ncbi:MAG: hypothetical protein GY870_05955 [archaeon]|nr:hypothetical protein [archaeon]
MELKNQNENQNEIDNKKAKKIVCLLSGGLDSPIATYLMAKKGYECLAITFLTGDDPQLKNRDKVRKIAERIKELTGAKITLYVAKHNPTVELFKEKGLRKMTCVMCKRYMLRAARHLALKENAVFIVNGDILGEQATQTLDNLVQVQRVLDDVPVIRPLIGFEKADVIKMAQKLGLYELSSLQAPGCTHNPKYPETHAKEKDIWASEEGINYDKMVKRIMNEAEIINIS